MTVVIFYYYYYFMLYIYQFTLYELTQKGERISMKLVPKAEEENSQHKAYGVAGTAALRVFFICD